MKTGDAKNGLFVLLALMSVLQVACASDLEIGFKNPPAHVHPWVYWRWPWSYAHKITRQAITDDLEAMSKQGIGGAMLDTVGSVENKEAAPYMSKAWLELIAHAHKEAQRLNVILYVHACDGWANTGGPWIEPEDAIKHYTFSKAQVKGPMTFDGKLPQPDASIKKQHQYAPQPKSAPFYRDVAVVAYNRSKPNAIPDGVVILTESLGADGHLKWEVPEGDWTILRFGWAITGAINETGSPAGQGLESDKLGARGIDAHIKGLSGLVDILADKPEGVQSYIGIDSWECGKQNWTQSLPEAFKASKGYDIIPWLPVLAGEQTVFNARFMDDFNDLCAEMVQKNHVGRLTQLMHKRGIRTQCEFIAGGSDVPCGEYWAVSEGDRAYGPNADLFNDDLIRRFASLTAANIGPIGRGLGRNVIAAESFTARSQNWERTPFALKSGLDWALCAGINRTVFHLYAIQPDTLLKPHYMEHGTTVNRNLTWWNQAHAWFDYIARAQFMLQRGNRVADVCFIGNKVTDPILIMGEKHAGLLRGFSRPFDHDVAPWDRLINDMCVRDGMVVTPEGAAYRLLYLNSRDIPLDAMRKVRKLLHDGAVVLAQQKPQHARGLADITKADEEVRKTADELWGPKPGQNGDRPIGKGRMLWGYSPQQALERIGVKPGFASKLAQPNASGIDWAYRRDSDTDIFFVVNRAGQTVDFDATFRVADKAPELWDPDSTEITKTALYRINAGLTTVPLRLEAYESVFVVFREPAKAHIEKAQFTGGSTNAVAAQGLYWENGKIALTAAAGEVKLFPSSGESMVVKVPQSGEPLVLTGSWDVRFIGGMGAPEKTTFKNLINWTTHDNYDIKHYSGQATYTKTFSVSQDLLKAADILLDLGEVRDLVDISINGKMVTTLWRPPYRVLVKAFLKPGDNQLEITVANTWVNRFVGDLKNHGLDGTKPDKGPRYTFHGISTQTYTDATPILPSGLMGPVRLVEKPAVTLTLSTPRTLLP
jgi:hypothetical protein